jgi:hypothetical protein
MGSLTRTSKRSALIKPNPEYLWWRYVGNGWRVLRAMQSQPSYDDSPRVARDLTAQGIVVGTTNQYLGEEGREALVEASDLVLGLSRGRDVQAAIAGDLSSRAKDYLVQLVAWEQEHSPDSPLLRLALDKKLLEIVSLYLGMWPRLHAIGAWLNFPSADAPKQAQLWHRDPEDLQLIKVFIYLVDVDNNCGPFSYIPKTHPFSSGAALVPKHADKKRITDDEMQAAIPVGRWITCTGPANTMILADTVGYHRGGKPTVGNRILITFTYTSGSPHAKRDLRVNGTPNWTTHAIQRYAL